MSGGIAAPGYVRIIREKKYKSEKAEERRKSRCGHRRSRGNPSAQPGMAVPRRGEGFFMLEMTVAEKQFLRG
jgi:hypothetical protein